MFRVSYTEGNDYQCGCCRRTWDHTEDFSTLQEAVEFAADIRARAIANDEDVYVTDIERIEDEIDDWEGLVETASEPLIKKAENKKKAEKRAEKKRKEDAERKKLAELKSKYEVES